MSYTGTRRHLKHLTQEANVLQRVQSGKWVWVYNNLNIHQKVRHECQGIFMCIYTCYELLTSDRLPLIDAQCDSTACCWHQISATQLQVHKHTTEKSQFFDDDILLSSEDGEVLVKRAVRYSAPKQESKTLKDFIVKPSYRLIYTCEQYKSLFARTGPALWVLASLYTYHTKEDPLWCHR